MSSPAVTPSTPVTPFLPSITSSLSSRSSLSPVPEWVQSPNLKKTIELQEQNPTITRLLFGGREHDTNDLPGDRCSSTAFDTESRYSVDSKEWTSSSTPSRKRRRGDECHGRPPLTKTMLGQPRTPPSIQDQIRESYAGLGLTDLANQLQFGDPYTDKFNPYRVQPKAKAILQASKLSTIRKTVRELTKDLVSLDQDSQLPQPDPKWKSVQPHCEGNNLQEVLLNVAEIARNTKDTCAIWKFYSFSVSYVFYKTNTTDTLSELRKELKDKFCLYLCLHALCYMLKPAWNGRHLSLITRFCTRLTRIATFFGADHRPVALHQLLESLNNIDPLKGSSSSMTALDHVATLTRGYVS